MNAGEIVTRVDDELGHGLSSTPCLPPPLASDALIRHDRRRYETRHRSRGPRTGIGDRTFSPKARSELSSLGMGAFGIAVVDSAHWLVPDPPLHRGPPVLLARRVVLGDDPRRVERERSRAGASLANITVYPPLYFVILFEWMNWFGDSELATRLLSIIYITLAGLFLYSAAGIGFSKRIALASVITFNLMYTPLYYSLETRPYAQTMFLVTVSSYLLLRILRRGMHEGWRRALVSPTGSIFVVANSALLLTHYYNAFFWVAQGLVACIFVLCEMRPRTWLKGIGSVAVLYGMQAAIFVGVWGRNLLREFGERSGPFTIAGAGELPNPFSTLLGQSCITQFQNARIVGWVALVLVVVVGAGAFSVIARRTTSSPERIEAWTTIYVLSWMVLPVVVLYLGFLVTGVALYLTDTSLPALFLSPPSSCWVWKRLLVQSQVLPGASAALPHRDAAQKVWAVLLVIAVIGLLVFPQGYAAATKPKNDWRGAARDIVNIVESNPESSYVIYETSFRPTPLLDYYLTRYSDDVRVTGTIQRSQEARAEQDPSFKFGFERNADLIGQHDFRHRPVHSPRHQSVPDRIGQDEGAIRCSSLGD